MSRKKIVAGRLSMTFTPRQNKILQDLLKLSGAPGIPSLIQDAIQTYQVLLERRKDFNEEILLRRADGVETSFVLPSTGSSTETRG